MPSTSPVTAEILKQVKMTLRTRRYFLAPTFCPVKLMAAVPIPVTAVAIKPLIFPPAVFADIIASPKEFTEDWMITLDMENREDCMPEGMPMRRIFLNDSLWMRSLEKKSLQASVRWARFLSTRNDRCKGNARNIHM